MKDVSMTTVSSTIKSYLCHHYLLSLLLCWNTKQWKTENTKGKIEIRISIFNYTQKGNGSKFELNITTRIALLLYWLESFYIGQLDTSRAILSLNCSVVTGCGMFIWSPVYHTDICIWCDWWLYAGICE